MHRFLVVFFFLPATICFTSLQSEIGSLKLLTAKSDRAALFNKLASNYLNLSVDTALYYSGKAIEHAGPGEVSEAAQGYLNLSIGWKMKGNQDTAKFFLGRSRELFQKSKDTTGLIRCLNNMGSWHRTRGEFDMAFSVTRQAILLMNKTNNATEAGACYTSLSIVYECVGKFDSALFYLDKSILAHQDAGQNDELAFAYATKGNLLFERKGLDTGIELLKKAYQLHEERGNTYGIAFAGAFLGNIFMMKGEYSKALEYLHEAFTSYEKLQFLAPQVYILQLQGLIYKNTGKYEEALPRFFKAVEVMEQLGNKAATGPLHNNIATVFLNWGKYPKALHHSKISLSYALEGRNNFLIASCNNQLGNIYFEQEILDSALVFYQEAEGLARKYEYLDELSVAVNNIGLIFQKQGKLNQAKSLLEEALELDKELQNERGQLFTLIDLGKLLVELKEFNLAETYFQNALDRSKEMGELSLRVKVLEGLSDLYGQWKKPEKANRALHEFIEAKDSLFSLEKHLQISELQTQYEVKEKQQAIRILEADKQIKEKEITYQKLIKWMLVFGFTGALAFIGLIALSYHKKNKALYSLIQRNKEIVEIEKNLLFDAQAVSVNRISNELFNELNQKLSVLFDKEKPYLNENLTIGDIAEKLETNSTYLSQVINQHYKKNFNSFVNEFRVREARRLLSDAAFAYYTIEAIAGRVGFKSKSVFNTAFKKYTGLTPSYYQKNNR